ncbi:hypothetical protein [Streptomyces sp. NBC_00233]|uniref:hypothetical protein n=1 Tax=Streptomyces sp. NBC_00233 TaxID=2975686 RepID=UPI00225952B4|nr:hypothetical protein [Streptomyces sp. NBC_00233]MCX5231470.1 hypothetical protein [Streptomyces sp. NBC_00233]MCX5233144.1 hypothetical protein [Streptomyces sp. NBC_00233]MCX5233586.1 hypothetical protein [Streptomyces sp. NBC_00233]
MRQSTTRHTPGNTDWMNRDNAFQRHYSRTGLSSSVSPNLRLQRLRSGLNQEVLTHVSQVRPTRRVTLYARVLPGQDPEPLFVGLRAEAACRGWQVGQELFDDIGHQAPQQSPEWLRVRKLCHEGMADGVLVRDRMQISTDDALYEEEIRFMYARQCITALQIPEAAP